MNDGRIGITTAQRMNRKTLSEDSRQGLLIFWIFDVHLTFFPVGKVNSLVSPVPLPSWTSSRIHERKVVSPAPGREPMRLLLLGPLRRRLRSLGLQVLDLLCLPSKITP